jgi:hypothetical protein
MEEVVDVEEVISKWWVRDGDLGRPERRRVQEGTNKGCTHGGWPTAKSNKVNDGKGMIRKGRTILTNNGATTFKM